MTSAKLSPPQEKRRLQLLNVLKALERGYPVWPRAIQKALSRKEYREYQAELERTWPPPQGREVETFALFKKLIRQGDLYEARAKKFPLVGRLAMKRWFLDCEAQRNFSAAVELATELLAQSGHLAHLFDREIDDFMDLSTEGIVRPKGSSNEFSPGVPDWELRERGAIQRRHARYSLAALEGESDGDSDDGALAKRAAPCGFDEDCT